MAVMILIIIVLFFGFLYLSLLFFGFICLFQRIFFPLFKGEVAVKFDRFNLGFWSWRWGDQLVMVSEVVGFIS